MVPPSSPFTLSYIHGPEPMGMVLSWSSVREAGNTFATVRRSFSSAKGYFSLMVTVLSSFSATESMNDRNAPQVASAMLTSSAFTTSATVTSVPSENLAPSRRATSYSVSETFVGSPAASAL